MLLVLFQLVVTISSHTINNSIMTFHIVDVVIIITITTTTTINPITSTTTISTKTTTTIINYTRINTIIIINITITIIIITITSCYSPIVIFAKKIPAIYAILVAWQQGSATRDAKETSHVVYTSL